MNVVKLLGNPTQFLESLVWSLDQKRIDVSGLELDHVCYRVETKERYDELVGGLATCGRLLTEAEISGRMIATFELHKPLIFGDWRIYLIELPEPKEGSFYEEGYEHVEFVIDCALIDFIEINKGVTFGVKGMHKKRNPDITLELEKGMNVKFHLQSLKDVIVEEQMEDAW